MKEKEAENRIKELVDQEFLDKLVEVARIYGWSGDYTEVCKFIEEISSITRLPIPNDLREPFEIDYEDDEIAEYMHTDEFQKNFEAEVNKTTWDLNLPKVYSDKEGHIVRHWKDGKIEMIIK